MQRDDAHRDVDVEDPPPARVIDDEAAQRRTDRRGEDHRQAVHREAHPALPGLEGVGQDALLARGQPASADPLQHPEEDQRMEVGREPAQGAAEGEEDHAGHVEALAAHPAGDPGADRQHHGVGDQVRGQHPGRLVLARGEPAGDVGERHVGDGGVQHLHERGQGDRQAHQPRAVPGSPGDLRMCLARHAVTSRRRPGPAAPGRCSARTARAPG